MKNKKKKTLEQLPRARPCNCAAQWSTIEQLIRLDEKLVAKCKFPFVSRNLVVREGWKFSHWKIFNWSSCRKYTNLVRGRYWLVIAEVPLPSRSISFCMFYWWSRHASDRIATGNLAEALQKKTEFRLQFSKEAITLSIGLITIHLIIQWVSFYKQILLDAKLKVRTK